MGTFFETQCILTPGAIDSKESGEKVGEALMASVEREPIMEIRDRTPIGVSPKLKV